MTCRRNASNKTEILKIFFIETYRGDVIGCLQPVTICHVARFDECVLFSEEMYNMQSENTIKLRLKIARLKERFETLTPIG